MKATNHTFLRGQLFYNCTNYSILCKVSQLLKKAHFTLPFYVVIDNWHQYWVDFRVISRQLTSVALYEFPDVVKLIFQNI